MQKLRVGVLVGAFVLGAVAVGGAGAGGKTPFGAAKPAASSDVTRYIVQMKSGAGAQALSPSLQATGARVALTIPSANIQVVSGSSPGLRQALAANPNVVAVARDGIKKLVEPTGNTEFYTGASGARQTVNVPGGVGSNAYQPPVDPAFNTACNGVGFPYPCMMWSQDRIGVPSAWNGSYGGGSTDVLVAVADTGIDYTHVDLAGKVAWVVDFTTSEDPNICDTYFGADDDYVANTYWGGAVAPDNDFNGHGSWIAGNIAGRLNGIGVNGIAPGVSLVALKISGWCGSAYDSTILAAMYYAANQGIDVFSISFGGYTDRTDPDQNLSYRMYETAVNYGLHKGTLYVASAGNEHSRIGAGGRVLSHGALAGPPGGDDNYGLWQTPGGVPGFVDVSSTGNVVNAPSAAPCPADALAAGNGSWCKPLADAHQSFGVGRKDQLAYYSNYGTRIDIAGPGGARKFNLPAQDRGGCEGWPICGFGSVTLGSSVADGYNAWEDFSTMSNWTVSIPCIAISGGGFTGECYSTIQGTSMATPHVSAAAALVATAFPAQARHKPKAIIDHLKRTATRRTAHGNWNTTPPLSTDTSGMDVNGNPCTYGWCHLGGAAIKDSEAYGAGIVNADRAIHPPH